MPRLTKRVVDHLEPRASGDLFAWDSLLPGFGVRVLPSGRKTYLVQYRDGHGRTRRYALGAHGVLTPEQARALAQDALARVRSGENPSVERRRDRQAVTVAQLVNRYERDYLPTLAPRTQQGYRFIVAHYILPALGSLAVPAVTTDDLARLHGSLAHIPDQANRMLSIVRTLFVCAEHWQMRPPHTNPSLFLRRYPERTRERALSPLELARLGAAMQDAETLWHRAARGSRPGAAAAVYRGTRGGNPDAALGMDRPARETAAAAGLQDGCEDHLSVGGGPAGPGVVWTACAGAGGARHAPWQSRRRIPPRCSSDWPKPRASRRLTRMCSGIRMPRLGSRLGLSLPVVGTLLGP